MVTLSTSKDKTEKDIGFYKRMFFDLTDDELINKVEKKVPDDDSNLEYFLRTNEYFLSKARSSIVYAQHLYAAMCNNQFQKVTTWNVLSDNLYSCSWRYAGGIVAHMRQEGDYMDWYCSGYGPGQIDTAQMTSEQLDYFNQAKQFMPEGVVSDEVREDLLKFDWVVVPYDNKDI